MVTDSCFKLASEGLIQESYKWTVKAMDEEKRKGNHNMLLLLRFHRAILLTKLGSWTEAMVDFGHCIDVYYSKTANS
jgi:hypothetical protein